MQASIDAFQCLDCHQPVPITRHADPACPACGRTYAWKEGLLTLGSRDGHDDYPDEIYDFLRDIEPRHFWFGERNRLILRALGRVLGILHGRTVLDVGCGTGFVLAALEQAGMVACGIDVHEPGLRIAQARSRALLLTGNATGVPFEASFDAALLCDVIEHTVNDVEVLRDVARALKPGGALLVTVPAHPELWSVVDVLSGHKRRYTPASLRQVLAAAGLHTTLLHYFNAALLPLQLIQRLTLNRLPHATQQEQLRLLTKALRPPPEPLNTLLRWACRADIPLGRLPRTFGSSLVAVAYPRSAADRA